MSNQVTQNASDLQEQIKNNRPIPFEELVRFHSNSTNNDDLLKPEGTKITSANEAIVRFNGYYGLNIISGNHKGSEGAFFTIDTNMYVTTTNGQSTPQFYVQFILSMDGKSSVKIPFTGSFTQLASGDYLLEQKANGIGGMNEVSLNLTFSRTQEVTTAELSGDIVIAAPGQGQSVVSGSTYNNPILAATYAGTYYDHKDQKETLIIGDQYELQYRSVGKEGLQRIENYQFNLNMYVFSFGSPTDSTAKINLVMGTSPASGLVCGDLKSGPNITTTERTLNTIKSAATPPKIDPLTINMHSNDLAAFSAYYPIPTADHSDAFIAIQATRIPIVGSVDIYEVMIGLSLDGNTPDVYNFDSSMEFDVKTNTLKIPNPAYGHDPETNGKTVPVPPQYIVDVSFTRKYIENGMSGHLIELDGHIMGNHVTTSTPFNLIPLEGFMGAPLTNSDGETLVVNSSDEVTYRGHKVGALQTDNILYVPIMYILEFTNPAPKDPVEGYEYKVVCSFGTDGERGLACIVTEYTIKGKDIIQHISYYHSVPKNT